MSRGCAARQPEVDTSLNPTVTPTAAPCRVMSPLSVTQKLLPAFLMFSYRAMEVWLLFRFLEATIPSGVKGLMFAIFGFSDTEVESHSCRSALDSDRGKEERLDSPSSSKRSRDFIPKSLGAVLGELMAQTLLGDPRPSNSLMALMVWEGGEGEFRGLSEKRVLASLGH